MGKRMVCLLLCLLCVLLLPGCTKQEQAEMVNETTAEAAPEPEALRKLLPGRRKDRAQNRSRSCWAALPKKRKRPSRRADIQRKRFRKR